MQIQEVLKECGIEAETVLKQRSTVTIQKRPEIEIKLTNTSYTTGTVNRTATVHKFKIAEKILQERKIPGRLFIESTVGYPFGCFPDIKHLKDEGKEELQHQPGEVLLVSIWATWSKGCLRPMQQLQSLMEMNETAWGNRVRVVAVNVDEKSEEAVIMAEEQKWNKMQHLTILGWDKSDALLENFAVQGLPFIVLVDQFGKVDFEGDPNHLPLEGRINQLLFQEEEQPYQKPAIDLSNYRTNFQEAQRKLKEELTVDKVKENFVNSELFCCRLTVQAITINAVTYKQFLLEVSIFQGDLNAAETIRHSFQSISGVDVKLNEVKYMEVPQVQHPICWQCQTALQFPYYWLRWQEGTHFGCLKCVQKPSEDPKNHYSYKQNSILLKGNWNKIPLKGLGNNLQPSDISSFTKDHQFACNACQACSPLGEPRYICLGCRAEPNYNYDLLDLCQRCITKVEQKTQQILKCFEKELHCTNHPWLRVLYHAGSYLRF